MLIPFFNYIFGLQTQFESISSTSGKNLKQKLENLSSLTNNHFYSFFIQEQDENELEARTNKLLATKFEPGHQFNSLNQIGCELLLAIILNGECDQLPDELKPKFTYGKKICNRSTINHNIIIVGYFWFLSKFQGQL